MMANRIRPSGLTIKCPGFFRFSKRCRVVSVHVFRVFLAISMFRRMFQNRTTERDLRDWLSGHGYYGSSTQFDEIELHAIQRPGWLQVFRFSVSAKTEQDQWHELFGVVRDDERYRRLDVEIFQLEADRDEILTEWSTGLIVRRRRRK